MLDLGENLILADRPKVDAELLAAKEKDERKRRAWMILARGFGFGTNFPY
jgi:hypothetical protein